MTDAKKTEQAKAVYSTILSVLDGRGWKYDQEEEKNTIFLKLSGDDLPMDFVIRVLEEQQVISIISFMPTSMPEDKRVEGAIATTIITNQLADGSFDYDVSNGAIMYRITSSFKDSLIGEKLIGYMIDVSALTVDEYNDKLFMLAKGVLSLEDFMKEQLA